MKRKTSPDPVNTRAGSAALTFGLGLFVLTLAVYVGIAILNQQQNKHINATIADLEQKQTAFDRAKADKMLLLSARLQNIRSILKNHPAPLNIFAFLELKTLPQVWYSQFSLDTRNDKLSLDGHASSYALFAKQVNSFEAETDTVSAIQFSNLTRDIKTGMVGFHLAIDIRPTVLAGMAKNR